MGSAFDHYSSRLSDAQRTILKLASVYQLEHGGAIPGRYVRLQFPPEDEERVQSVLQSLVPDYLDTSGRQNPYDHYWMTPAGLVLSAEGPRVTGLIEALLSFFRARVSEDLNFSRFTWGELKDRGVAKGDQEFRLVDTTISIMRLHDGGSGTPGPPPSFEYRVPPDVDKLRRFRSFDDLLELRLRQREEERRGFAEFVRERHTVEVPPINIYHQGDINVGPQFNPTITNSNVGAVAVGDQAQAFGIHQGAPTQGHYRTALKEAQKALIDDEDHLDPKIHEALQHFLRLAREIQVEQRALAAVQAELVRALDETWAAKGLQPPELPAELRVITVLAQNPVTADVAKKLLGTGEG